jgi:hypothetical protein
MFIPSAEGMTMTREPYQKAIEDCLAAANDAIAYAKGCSEYERGLRQKGPLLHGYDATQREITITRHVLAYERSKPWWAR